MKRALEVLVAGSALALAACSSPESELPQAPTVEQTIDYNRVAMEKLAINKGYQDAYSDGAIGNLLVTRYHFIHQETPILVDIISGIITDVQLDGDDPNLVVAERISFAEADAIPLVRQALPGWQYGEHIRAVTLNLGSSFPTIWTGDRPFESKAAPADIYEQLAQPGATQNFFPGNFDVTTNLGRIATQNVATYFETIIVDIKHPSNKPGSPVI